MDKDKLIALKQEFPDMTYEQIDIIDFWHKKGYENITHDSEMNIFLDFTDKSIQSGVCLQHLEEFADQCKRDIVIETTIKKIRKDVDEEFAINEEKLVYGKEQFTQGKTEGMRVVVEHLLQLVHRYYESKNKKVLLEISELLGLEKESNHIKNMLTEIDEEGWKS